MSNHPDTLTPGTVWYAEEGVDSDVVLSSRIRLARNLANFVFPGQCSADDAKKYNPLYSMPLRLFQIETTISKWRPIN